MRFLTWMFSRTAKGPAEGPTRKPEDAKYSKLYRKGYGVGPVQDLFDAGRGWAAFAEARSVLGVGCGAGAALRLLTDIGVERVVERQVGLGHDQIQLLLARG